MIASFTPVIDAVATVNETIEAVSDALTAVIAFGAEDAASFTGRDTGFFDRGHRE